MALMLDRKSIVIPAPTDVFDPRLGVDSVFRRTGAAVTASNETTGFEKENAYLEGFTFDSWQPGIPGVQWLRASLPVAYAANYLGIASHNLHTQEASVKVQHSTDRGLTWSDSSTVHAPGDSTPILILFDDVYAMDFRLWISSLNPVSIGVVNIGKVLTLDAPVQAPWASPSLARMNRFITEVSENGAFLGRAVVANGAELELDIRGIGMPWARDQWEEAVRLMESFPFFFAARDIGAEGGVAEREVFYGWATEQPSSGYSTNVYGRLRLKARGIVT